LGRKYLAFDIEIAKLLPGMEEWQSYRPLGITCAATYHGEGEPLVWFGHMQGEAPASQMGQVELVGLVEHLEKAVSSGFTLLTWNGLSFDFNVLAEESGLAGRCARLAWDHIDMMFHVFCLRGHTLGLDKAARGMGVPGKLPGMRAELAPRYWAEGKWAIVLDYVAQDVRTTLSLARAVERQGALSWTSDRGARQMLPLRDGWLKVEEALTLPEPDTSWMSKPRRRDQFSSWMTIK